MASKAVVSTTLSFGLVSTPVSVKKAVSGRDAAGTQISSATPDGHRAGYAYVDKDRVEEIVGKALANGKQPDAKELGETFLPYELGDKGKVVQKPLKGIFEKDGTFFPVEQSQLELIDEQTKLQDLEIAGFIPLSEVPFERTTDAYFLTPGGKSAASVKPLALLRDGLKERKVAGFGSITLRTKTYPFIVWVKDDGIILNTLAYAATFDASEAAESISAVATDEKTLAMAGTLIDQLTVDAVNLDGIKNDRVEAREEVIAKVLAGEKLEPVAVEAAAEEASDDLAALLQASIGVNAPVEEKPKKAAAKKKVAA